MKNKEIQPFIKTTTKNVIYKMSYITSRSVKQICRDLCLHTLRNKDELAEELLPYMKWSIRIENNVYSPQNEPLEHYPLSGNSLERVNVRIDLNLYEFVRGLAFSLGWSPAKVIAYCIERSMSDFDFLNQYIVEHLKVSMVKNQKLNKIIKDINEILNKEQYSISALLIGIVDELKPSDQNLNEALYELVEKW